MKRLVRLCTASSASASSGRATSNPASRIHSVSTRALRTTSTTRRPVPPCLCTRAVSGCVSLPLRPARCPSRPSSVSRRHFSSSPSSEAGILIWADHDGKKLHPSAYSLVTAAKQISSSLPITILITGTGNTAPIAQQAAALPVTAVLTCDDAAFDHQLPEPVSALLVSMLKDGGFSYLLVASTSNGKNVLPRVAVGLDSQPVTEVVQVVSPDTFVRPIYAGNALCKVQLTERLKLLSIRPTSFEKTLPAETAAVQPAAQPASSSPSPSPPLSSYVREELTQSSRPDLSTARVVVSGGRGLKSADNFQLLTRLADLLHGAVGASRAAVDAGMVSNDHQVGQTGKVVAPELYLAVGISGAIQHLAGMKDSKVIVAVNKDAEAPIFQVADYGIVGDLFQVLPELTNKIEAAQKK